jgi:hypothetical protein
MDLVERSCRFCGGTFEIERKPGRPREYCFVCEPVGFKIVKVPGQSRLKLRRWPPSFSRSALDGVFVARRR